jgi:outer membrane protein TolC
VALVSLGGAATAHAQQISDERLHELMREAEAAVAENRLFTEIKVPTGGPTRALTLDQAVEFALERNLDIAVQRLNPQLQDVSIASARSAYSPTLTSNLSQSSTQSPAVSQLQQGTGGGGVQSKNLTYNGGFTQNMTWGGGQLSATLNNSRQSSNSNNANFNPQYNSTWTVQYAQPLLRDFKIDQPRRTLQVSRINRDVSEIQLRASVTNTVANVQNAYWDYVYATQAVEAAQTSLDLANKLVEDNQTRVEVGTMAPIDIVSAQAEQASRRQALVAAQSTRRTSELALKALIVAGTDDPNWNVTLDPVDRPEFRPQPVDVQAAVRRAIAERTDLEIARKNLETNRLSMSYLKNQSLPTLDLNVNYGVQGVGGTQFVRSNSGILGSAVTTTIPGGVTDALNSIFKNDNPRWTVGVSLNYPLGLTSQQTSLARARLQATQVGTQLQQIELQIARDITNAAINLENTAESVNAAQASRELSERRLEAEQSKFEVGMSTNYQVVQAQRDLNVARDSELRAILNYRRSLVEWERLQQTSLSGGGITIIQ